MSRSVVPLSTRSQRLVMALVWAGLSWLCLQQTIGILHAVVHWHGHVHEHTHAEAVQVPALHQHHDDDGFLASLFGSHEEDSSDCRLFDQSSHCDAIAGLPPLVLPQAIAARTCFVFSGLAGARWQALFQARGPPFIR